MENELYSIVVWRKLDGLQKNCAVADKQWNIIPENVSAKHWLVHAWRFANKRLKQLLFHGYNE